MTQTSLNNVSIRLKSGGHTFSDLELKEIVGKTTGPVDVVVLSPKTTLVPAELFKMESAADYLIAVGLAPCVDECVVCSSAVDGVVAVMAMSKKCHDALNGYEHIAGYVTPFLCGENLEKGSMLHLEDGLLYVRVYDNGLRFAEVMECLNDVDILYYLTKIDEVYNIYNTCARATGDTARIKRVTKYIFKELICE